jgi:hypothetical protein
MIIPRRCTINKAVFYVSFLGNLYLRREVSLTIVAA